MPINLPKSPFLGLILLLAACSKGPADVPPAHIERDSIPDQWAQIAPNHRQVDSVFGSEIEKLLPPLDSVEQVLGRAFANDTTVRFFGVANPYNPPIITAGDSIYIGLNHYLGPDFKGYLGRFPSYVRRLKVVERIPVDVVMARIAQQHQPDYPPYPNLLNHILYQGATCLAVRQTLGDETPLWLVLGMTPEELQWCEKNEGAIWQTMVSHDYLFSTDSRLIRALVTPQPISTPINIDAPGLAALYTGYRIAEAYCKQAGITPLQMLDNKDYNNNSALATSKYAPKR